ncbi:MAG: hypothetical protein IKK97_03970 [Phascolarctobacterium sp.]|nr:hypothetical protein [Phascolarctobacterium sp.]
MLGREVDIKNDVVIDGIKYSLSTVSFEWIGSLGHKICGYNYETMLFAYDGDNLNWDEDLYCERYADKESAEKRHNELLQLLNKGEKFWEEC